MRALRAVLGTLLIGLIALCVAVPIHAQFNPTSTPAPFSVVIPADIYVRAGPAGTFPTVGSLRAGNVLRPISLSEDGEWVLIRYGRGVGWVRRDLGAWVENLDALPVVPDIALTVTPQSSESSPTPFFATETPEGNWVRLENVDAFLRSGPGREFRIIGAVPSGETVEPAGRDATGDWILIRAGEGFAWVSRPLVSWADDLESLPVLTPPDLTPSPTPTRTLRPSRTPTPTATDTPSATATLTATGTPSATATQVPSETPSATFTVTSTNTAPPTATRTIRPTATRTPTSTVAATATASLRLMTNTPAGAGGIEPTETSRPATVAPSATNTDTPAPTATRTQRPTTTGRPTQTPEPTDTPTVQPTRTPSPTETESPTATASSTVGPTQTIAPSETATARATRTSRPTQTTAFSETATAAAISVTQSVAPASATHAATRTPRATGTVEATRTQTATATETESSAPLVVPATRTTRPSTTTEQPRSPSPAPSETTAPSDTPVSTPTLAPVASDTVAPTMAATGITEATASLEPTEEAATEATAQVIVPGSDAPSEPPPPASGDSGLWPAVLIAVIALAIAIYAYFYWRGSVAARRHDDGFVLDRCPVCGRGQLSVDTRVGRVLGVPRPSHTVRCNTCRSLLREVRPGRWRYAVDPLENPEMAERYNGKVLSEAELRRLDLDRRSRD